MDVSTSNVQIQSTAGAVSFRNEKGEISMKKVKVQRYVTGKRPEFAPSSEDEQFSDEEFAVSTNLAFQSSLSDPMYSSRAESAAESTHDSASLNCVSDDPRLKRLRSALDRENNFQLEKRKTQAPVLLSDEGSDAEGDRYPTREKTIIMDDSFVDPADHHSESSESDDDLNDDEVARKRQIIRERVLANDWKHEELLDVEDDRLSDTGRGHMSDGGASSSEYEEYTDSDCDNGPRLKPVFVKKEDRITVYEKEKELLKEKQQKTVKKKLAEERRKDTLKIVESEIRRELQTDKSEQSSILDVDTEDENDEIAYESWKVRELRRIKRYKEEREMREKELIEIERIRKMSDEQRRADYRQNPRVITNRAVKGKYKFLQKYYHRGSFYLDEERDVLKQDFSAATLEDIFDKTVLPTVMQVKNFGRSGRTKYTHLVDQDTTVSDAPWSIESAQNIKFFSSQAAASKQSCERPSARKKRVT